MRHATYQSRNRQLDITTAHTLSPARQVRSKPLVNGVVDAESRLYTLQQIEWSTVSKAADMSKRIRAATSPRSTAFKMTDSTRNIAVSTEWPGRNPHCKDGRRSWRRQIRHELTDNKALDELKTTQTDFDIGRYELTSESSSPGFFTSGVMNASLKPTWKGPVASDRLNNSTTYGAMRSMICFRTFVGIGSAAEDLSGSRRTASTTSSVVSGENCRKVTPDCKELYTGGGASQHLGDFVNGESIERFHVDCSARWYSATNKQYIYRPPCTFWVLLTL